MDNNVIYYSRCSVGKGKWFWVVKTRDGYVKGNDPFAMGYGTTAEEAEAMAVAAARKAYPGCRIGQGQAWVAKSFRCCLVAKAKAKKQSESAAS